MIWPVINFAVIPAMYPVMIRRMNGKLVPFAVLALYALITLSGQERPKQINIIDSKIDPIIIISFVFFVMNTGYSRLQGLTIF